MLLQNSAHGPYVQVLGSGVTNLPIPSASRMQPEKRNTLFAACVKKCDMQPLSSGHAATPKFTASLLCISLPSCSQPSFVREEVLSVGQVAGYPLEVGRADPRVKLSSLGLIERYLPEKVNLVSGTAR